MGFYTEKERVFKELSKFDIWVLATADAKKTTARSMSVVIINDLFYMQTDINSVKLEQIKVNPQVALCCGNVQIEAIAEIEGHPLNEKNINFIEKYKRVHKNAFDKYTALPNEVLLCMRAEKIKTWLYEESQAYIEELDLKNETFKKYKYV